MNFVWPTSHVGMLHPLAAEGSRPRAQGLEFLRFAQASVDGLGYERAKRLLKVSRHQAETRKAFYQELGLLYVEPRTDAIKLTAIGHQLLDLLGTDPVVQQPDEIHARVDALLAWSLNNSQINRPLSTGSPRHPRQVLQACTVKPYAAFWQALIDLDDRITHAEFLHALAPLYKAADYEAAIDLIRKSRLGKGALPVATATTDNFMIYWKAHLTVADRILSFDQANQVFSFRPERRALIEAILGLQTKCSSDKLGAITSATWISIDDYYERIGGRECPPFLARGGIKLAEFGNQQIFVLDRYQLAEFSLEGGPELCELPLKATCFHSSETNYLLRLDRKLIISPGKVVLQFGRGRRINDVNKLLSVLND
jgi:hypothetical protein